MKQLVIGFSVFVVSFLGSTLSAQACSYPASMHSGMDDYFVYNSYELEDLLDDETTIAVVTTKKTGTLRPDHTGLGWGSDPERSPNLLIKMKLDVIELLKGKELSNLTRIVPEMDQKEKRAAIARLERKNEFDHWDGFQFSAQTSNWYGEWTSCGLSGDKVLLNDQHYLLARKESRHYAKDFILEPITGLDDPLVAHFRNLIQDNAESPLKITPNAFFENMEGYKVFDVMACPFKQKDDETDEEKTVRWNLQRQLEPDDYDKMNYIYGVVEDSNPSIALKPQNFIFRSTCQIGDRYLVIERQFKSVNGNSRDFPAMDNPKHRYLRVSNGLIDIADIPTEYEIQGSSKIPVGRVKTWIREGVATNNP